MAIIIEEEKNKISLISIATWLVVLLIIGLAVYYIFFSQPELVEIAAPAAIQNLDPLRKINISPDEIVNSPAFHSLKSTVTLPTPGNTGRSNPFLAP
jgi:hypothetical protein